MALSPEVKAKISESMKMRHAERAKAKLPWKAKNKKAGSAKLDSSLVRQLEKEIEERQLLLKLLKERGVQ